ncbi:MAG: hemerythrin domain-containing protein [Betaproteobacteria bacterium]
MDPIQAWQTEHRYFRQLLALLEKEVDRFHRDSTPNYELMLDIISYLREYSDQFHHPREDAAFARLARSCPDLELVLARLDQEHRVIAHAGEALRQLVQAVVAGAVMPRVEVEMAAATYLVYYGNHIGKEDEDILGRAAAVLTPEDWEAVRVSVAPVSDPLFGNAPAERFRELRRRIALEA